MAEGANFWWDSQLSLIWGKRKRSQSIKWQLRWHTLRIQDLREMGVLHGRGFLVARTHGAPLGGTMAGGGTLWGQQGVKLS